MDTDNTHPLCPHRRTAPIDFGRGDFCLDCGQVRFPWAQPPAAYRVNILPDTSPPAPQKKCECGSSACGSNFHSDWCPCHPDYKITAPTPASAADEITLTDLDSYFPLIDPYSPTKKP